MDKIDRDAIHEFRLRRMLGIEKQHAERQKRLEPITKEFDYGPIHLVTVHEVGEEFQIAEVRYHDEQKSHFCVFHNLKSAHYTAESFDEALLIALAAKYDRPDGAPRYMARMFGMPTTLEPHR
jgi:hypothetical protein